MITAQAEAKNTRKKWLWQHVQQTEQSRQMSRRVKKALGINTQHAGLTQVTGPTKENTMT